MAQVAKASYPIAKFGLATSFTESETPADYALKFRNRFINAAGGAEKRQGSRQIGNDIPGTPNIDGVHELIENDGTAKLLASGGGAIYLFSGTSAWSQVNSGFDTVEPLRSVQMENRLIFYNGVDRPIFTTNGSTFSTLQALVAKGELGGTVSANTTDDANVTDWITDTDVAVNDIVRNVTKGGYGIITAIASTNVTHTNIASAGQGTGLGGLGTGNQVSGDRYEIIDLVDLNVIPTAGDDDNVATLGPGTSARVVAVSGVNFATTKIRRKDIIHNTTRSAIAMVCAVNTALTVTSIAAQTSGDSITLFKSAMPIVKNAHVHFGRAYYVDGRDEQNIRVSGPDDPQDMSTDQQTLDSSSLRFGNFQPQGDILQDIKSFQRFLAIGGKQNVYLFSGTNPIADTSADTSDLAIIGLFPQGVVSPQSMISLGNDLAFVTPDGVQSVSLVSDSSQLGRANLSEPLRTTLRNLIKNTPEAQIQVYHYPRRSWLMVKIGSQLYVFNYTAYLGQDQLGRDKTLTPQAGSWSLFDGKLARQNAYLVRQNSDLVAGGAGGKVFRFDVDGAYDDDGEVYTTEYQTSWLTIEEPRKTPKIKQGLYIQPVLETGAAISYDITAEGDFQIESRETITVEASGGASPIGLATIPHLIGGSPTQERKFALRWRGKQVRITYTTEDSNGPDIISRFTLFANLFGAR